MQMQATWQEAIDIEGLNPEDKALIKKIGWHNWLERIAKEQENRRHSKVSTKR